MANTPLINHMIKTYQSVRWGLAIIGGLFPLILWGWGAYKGLTLQGSMSSYYHARPLTAEELAHVPPTAFEGSEIHVFPGEGTMRNWFVGSLFAIGVILYLYKGFTRRENYALNFAGAMAWGVALFPESWGEKFMERQLWGMKFSVHGFCAMSLFFGIAYVCIFRAPDTLHLVQDKARRERYRRTYKTLGGLMILLPATAFVLSSIWEGSSTIFWVEAAGVEAFALYWYVKTRELSETGADRKAVHGEMAAVPEEEQEEMSENGAEGELLGVRRSE